MNPKLQEAQAAILTGKPYFLPAKCGCWDITLYPTGGCFHRPDVDKGPLRILSVVDEYRDGSPHTVIAFDDRPGVKAQKIHVKFELLKPVV